MGNKSSKSGKTTDLNQPTSSSQNEIRENTNESPPPYIKSLNPKIQKENCPTCRIRSYHPEELFVDGKKWNRFQKPYPCNKESKSNKEIEKETSKKDKMERLHFLSNYEYFDHSKPNESQSSFKKITLINQSLLSPKILFLPVDVYEEEDYEELRKRSIERIYSKNDNVTDKSEEEEEIFFNDYIKKLEGISEKISIFNEFAVAFRRIIKKEKKKTQYCFTPVDFNRIFQGIVSIYHLSLGYTDSVKVVKETHNDLDSLICNYARTAVEIFPFYTMYRSYYTQINRSFNLMLEKQRYCEPFRDLKIELENEHSEKLEELLFTPITQMRIFLDFSLGYLKKYGNSNRNDINLYLERMKGILSTHLIFFQNEKRKKLNSFRFKRIYEMLSDKELKIVVNNQIRSDMDIFDGVEYKMIRIAKIGKRLSKRL